MNIREKIALKHEAVSLGTRKGSDGASEEESGFKSEVFVKSGVISVKDEVAAMSTPKILGKIDLSGRAARGVRRRRRKNLSLRKSLLPLLKYQRLPPRRPMSSRSSRRSRSGSRSSLPSSRLRRLGPRRR